MSQARRRFRSWTAPEQAPEVTTMGMFDYLTCEIPLPADPPPPPKGTEFQTKDTEAQFMEYYTITREGRLLHHSVRYEQVPKAERPYPDAADDSFKALAGSIRLVPTGDVDTNYHGYVRFYEYSETREWWEYRAKFTDGVCIELVCTEHRGPSAEPR
jgi:hypothetical protein